MSVKIMKFISTVLSSIMLVAAIPTMAMADEGYGVAGDIADGVLNAEITDSVNDRDITAYIAEYSSDGVLVRVTLDNDVRGGKEIKDYTLTDSTSTVKIFLWENMHPVTDKVFEIEVETEEPPESTPTLDPNTEYTTDIKIRFTDEEGNQIKNDITVETGKMFHSGDTYTVPEEYQKDILIKPAADGGMYTYYTFNAGTSKLTAYLEPENTILTLRFNGEQYNYYEDFEDLTVDTSNTEKWHIASNSSAPTIESDKTMYLKHSTTTTSTGAYMTFDEVNTENKTVKITADVKFTKPTADAKLGQFAVSNRNPFFSSNNIGYGIENSAGHIFALLYRDGTKLEFNKQTANIDFVDQWIHIEADADFGQEIVTIKLTNENGDIWEGEQDFYSSTVEGNVGSVYLRSPSTNGTVSVDNLTVKVTGDAVPAEPDIKSPLNYKSVYAFGDSIVYGHNAPAQSFMRLIANNYGMKLNMMAKNGATIMSGSNQILTQIKNAPSASPDFVVFEGYTNDAYGSAASDPEFNPSGAQRDVTACYGEMTADDYFGPTFNTDTFCGSFENTIYTMKQKWGEDTKYVFVTIHESNARNHDIQIKLRGLTMQICDKWDIAVVDMFTYENSAGERLCTYGHEKKDSYMNKYIINGDGSHPTVAACEEFYIPAIVGVMEGLCDDEPEVTESPDPDVTESPKPTESPEPDYEVEATYKFDFGAGSEAAEGYTAVTPDMVYDMKTSANQSEGYCGFLGTTATSYADDVLPYDFDNRAIDGFSLVKGQQIQLSSDGTNSATDPNSDYVTVPAKATYIPADASSYKGRFPIRFSMKADRKSYYTVTATVANSSATEDACVSLFSEKRQIIAEDIPLAVGETATFKFNVDIEDIFYKLYTGHDFEDDMLNISVSGENAALSSVIVEKHKKVDGKIKGAASDSVNNGTTMWLMTDSTGCDCAATVPFFALQNYAGVGQALIKYMPENIAVSNQGERGLASNDNMHLSKADLKPGDYLYVEYGHNDNGADSYKANLEKYYTRAHESGAKLIIASAINRHNNYNAENGGWQSDFTSYINAAKEFVNDKIDGGADDIAFVDLNTEYVKWMNEETTRITGINSSLMPQDAMTFYYRSVKGSAVDGTHMNDAGADQGAYAFFMAAKAIVEAADGGSNDDYINTQAEVVRPIVEGMKTKVGDTNIDNKPMVVSNEIINAGKAPNAYWDKVPSAALEYLNSAAVDSVGVTTNEDGSMTISSVDMRILKEITYAKAVVTVTQGAETKKYYTESNYDCTGDGVGSVKTNSGFITVNKGHTEVQDNEKVSTIIVPDGAECSVQIVACDDDWKVPENAVEYSVVYPIYPETETVFTDGMNDISAGTIWDSENKTGNDWTLAAAASTYSATVNEEGDGNYITAYSTGDRNYAFYKAIGGLEGLSDGRYRISFKTRLNAGMVRVLLAKSVESNGSTGGNEAKDYIASIGGNSVLLNQYGTTGIALDIVEGEDGNPASRINTGEWINVDGIFDLNIGKIKLSVGGSEYKEVNVENWRANTPSSLPTKYLVIAGASDGQATEADIKDIKVVKIPDGEAKKITVTASADSAQGNVTINGESRSSVEVDEGSLVTIKATANSSYKFLNWTTGADNTVVSVSEEYTTRVFEDLSLTANFEQRASDEIVWNFSDIGENKKEGVTADTSVTYNGLDINIKSGDSITENGLYWAAKSTGSQNDTATRFIHYKPEKSGTLTITIRASNVDAGHNARIYFNEGTDSAATEKSPLDSKGAAQYRAITAKDTDTKLSYTLEANKDYVFWAYLYSISSNFTISNITFTPSN